MSICMILRCICFAKVLKIVITFEKVIKTFFIIFYELKGGGVWNIFCIFVGMKYDVIDRLRRERSLADAELRELLVSEDKGLIARLKEVACEVARENFGREIKSRGLIEISNYCKNNCLYCGIRAGNAKVERYRLSKEEILECCEQGDALGFKTFVLQGGEDVRHTTEWVEDVVREIRRRWPEKAITLSLGERPDEDYERWFAAGADRYLLRHETANACHYAQLHPEGMSYENRVRCLQTLKRIGYETGTGMMVGSPGQTVDDLVMDLRFIEQLQPQMIGIGPFVSHRDTPFADCANGSVETTLRLIAILRLMHPKANIPATTSLGTLATDGREQGIMAGANVVMPNLSPVKDRKKYALYDNKICMDLEAAESRRAIEEQLKVMGYYLS